MNGSLLIQNRWYLPCSNSTSFSLIEKSIDNSNFLGTNVDLKFSVGIEKARKIKPELRTLIIGSLVENNGKYLIKRDITPPSLYFLFKEIWFYDLQTGEIFLKQKFDAISRELKDRTEDIEKRISKAKTLYEKGDDEASLSELRKILAEESNAEAYLLLGKINFRKGDLDYAIHSFKTALFWDNQLIEAHLLLAKIFLARKDCQQAQSYIASALAIDENSKEAIELKGQVEKCSR